MSQMEGQDCPAGAGRLAIIVHPLFTHTLAEPPVAYRHLGFDSLPGELLRHVCLQLDSAKDLINIQAVNRECRSVASDDLLWKPLCQRHFSVPCYAEPDSWRELYRFNYTAFKDLFLKGWYEQIDSLGGPIQLPNHAFVF